MRNKYDIPEGQMKLRSFKCVLKILTSILIVSLSQEKLEKI